MRRFAALAGIVAALVWVAPPVAAQPTGNGAVAQSPTISLADLGTSPTMSFYVNHEYPGATLSFPVPWGLSPVQFRAKLEMPLNIRTAHLAVTQGDRTLIRMNLPMQDQSEIVIPLEGMRISGGWASVDFAMDALPLDNLCWNDAARIQLVDGAITFRGNEAPPGTIADFLPSVLSKVTIAVPAKPSLAESSAAVQVAAAVANRNGQKPDVVVVPLPPGQMNVAAPSKPMERQIVVKEGGEQGLSLQGGPGVPSLLISGKGEELTSQARLLTDESLRLAVSAKTVAGALPGPDWLNDKSSVGELTQATLLSEATWPKVSIPLDQTRFGHPLGDIQVHLVGSYTPIPGDFGAELTTAVGGTVIDRWSASSDGLIDRMVTIPDRLLKRFMSLEVALRTTGNLGHCSDHLPATLRLDSNSALQVVDANPPIPQGFQSFPQALMPEVQFGIGTDAFPDTVRAAKIAVQLQRVSGLPLETRVTSIEQAIISGQSAVLVSPAGWFDPAITLPFTADDGKLTVQGLNANGDPTTLNVSAGAKFGSVQTIFDGSRSLLIFTSNGAPQLVDGLLDWLSQPGRWEGLDGRALISLPDTQPFVVPNPPIAPMPAKDASFMANLGQSLIWWLTGAVAAIAVVGGVLILRRAQRAGR